MIAHEQILDILNKYLQGFTHQRILLSSKKMKHDTIPLLLIAEPSIGSTHKGVCHSSLQFLVFCCYVAFQLLIPTIHFQKSAQKSCPIHGGKVREEVEKTGHAKNNHKNTVFQLGAWVLAQKYSTQIQINACRSTSPRSDKRRRDTHKKDGKMVLVQFHILFLWILF